MTRNACPCSPLMTRAAADELALSAQAEPYCEDAATIARGIGGSLEEMLVESLRDLLLSTAMTEWRDVFTPMTVDELLVRLTAAGACATGAVRPRRRPVLAGRGDHRRLGGPVAARGRVAPLRGLRRHVRRRWIHHRSPRRELSDRRSAGRDSGRSGIHRRPGLRSPPASRASPRSEERIPAGRWSVAPAVSPAFKRRRRWRRASPDFSPARRTSSGHCHRTADWRTSTFPVRTACQASPLLRRSLGGSVAPPTVGAPDPADSFARGGCRRVGRRWRSRAPKVA